MSLTAALTMACVLSLVTASADAAAICKATSGAQTTALVELYTSEGCSSCPPADAWLREAPASRYRPEQIVPLALHVPYWDYIGWKDAFAQEDYARRQSQLVAQNGHRTVYTPQFFVSGIEIADWRSALDADIRRQNALPATAQISLDTRLQQPRELVVSAEATATGEERQLFLAITEDNLASTVNAGENRGATLRHDHVLRKLIGPLAMPGGKIALRKTVTLEPGWRPDRLGVAAFVQDARSGKVQQAVSTAACRFTL